MKALLLMTATLAACSGDLDDLDAATPSVAPVDEQYGLVVLSRTVGEPGVAVSGQLLDFAGVDRRAALTALATPDDVWLAAPPPDARTCRTLTMSAEPIAVDARIDVLDAGPLQVGAPSAEGLTVRPHELPPVVAAIAGVVYDAEDPDALPEAHDLYTLSAPGLETAAVRGQVAAPEAVRLLSADFDEDGLRVRGAGGEGLVLLSRVDGGRTLGVLCSLDAAPMHVDWATLSHLGSGPADLAVLAVRRAPLLIGGADAGDLLFVVRDADELTIPREF